MKKIMDHASLRPKAMATVRAICDAWGDAFFQNLDDTPQTIIHTRHAANGEDEVLVVAVCPPDYSAAALAEVADGMREMFEPKRLIVVLRGDGANVKATKNAAFELWTEEELCCNVSKHALQYGDVHVLTKDEEDNLMSLLSLKRENLVRLVATDPLVKFYGITPGNVIRASKMRGTGLDVKYLLVEPK